MNAEPTLKGAALAVAILKLLAHVVHEVGQLRDGVGRSTFELKAGHLRRPRLIGGDVALPKHLVDHVVSSRPRRIPLRERVVG